MASIYRRPHSSVWQCAYYVPTSEGKRKQIRKSTGKESRREALQVATELERASIEAAGAGESKGRRVLAVLTRATEAANRGTLNAATAREHLSEILRITTGEDMPAFTIDSWSIEWLERKKATVSPASFSRYSASLNGFRNWLEDRASRPLESVTTADIRKFRDHLRSEGRAAKTCNFYVKDIASLFLAAIREGLIGRNPCSALDSLPQDDSVERLPFTAEEVRRLIDAATSPDWKGVVIIAAYTGLRLQDCAKLRWGDVDLSTGLIRVVPMKTRRKKTVVVAPMHKEVSDFLHGHPISDDPSAPIFPSLADKNSKGRSGLSMRFTGIMDIAGVSRGEAREATGKGYVTYPRSFHSLRHTFTSWLANANVPEDVRMRMTGHAIYTHFETETLAAAIASLPDL